MDARLKRKLQRLAGVIAFGAGAGILFSLALGYGTAASVVAGIVYGVLISACVGGVELFVLEGPMRAWLGGLSFAAGLLVRSAIYAAIIILIQELEPGERIAGLPLGMSSRHFWSSFAYSSVLSVVVNLGLAISNIIGPRALLNFVTGRYHSPVEEDRFVLFVDIAGSTGLAERLGGVDIHRFLDRTFRLLTIAVEDYRGEVLSYVGDEVIVTWPRRGGAIDCRPLHCFIAMRNELVRASREFEREFGAVPRIRGSLHFGPVIIGEIGDVKRAIVFNGDVMNTAARLEELSRTVEGGFLSSRTAMERFGSAPPFAVRDLGRLPIRGRADGIDVIGIDVAPAAA
jgi:adenylate cyclase